MEDLRLFLRFMIFQYGECPPFQTEGGWMCMKMILQIVSIIFWIGIILTPIMIYDLCNK